MMSTFKHWILHPFIFGLYPIVALLAYNINQIVPLSVVRPLLLGLLLALLFLLLFRLIFKNWHKAGLAATLSLILFFTYGHVHTLLHDRASGLLTKNQTTGLLWAVLFVAGMWLIARKIKDLPAWTRALNIIGLLLLAYALVQIGVDEVRSYTLLRQQQSPGSRTLASQLHPRPGTTLPDIYYIVPEDYTRSDGLQKIFGYDNSAFLAGLELKGFYIATCSRSNYSTSDASLASSLNMDYLDRLNSRFAPPNTDLSSLYPYIQNNAVLQTLIDLGYKFVSFQSGYSPTEFRDADVYLSPQTDTPGLQLLGGLTAFESMLIQTTALDYFYETRFFPPVYRYTLFDSAYLLHRNRILFELDKLEEVPPLPGPKFVFVHILAPHNPFVFGPNGEILHRNTPFTLNDDQDALLPQDYATGYDNQINYLDTRLLGDIAKILANSPTPPIILLQSDDGSTRAGAWGLAELNAYYLPGGRESQLYPSISPVNSFRVIFNAYFGGTLPILPDRACDSLRSNPFACTIKADPNPQCLKPQ